MADTNALPSMVESPMDQPYGGLEHAVSLSVAHGFETRDSGHFGFDEYLHTGVLDVDVDADDVAPVGTRALGERRTAAVQHGCSLNISQSLLGWDACVVKLEP